MGIRIETNDRISVPISEVKSFTHTNNCMIGLSFPPPDRQTSTTAMFQTTTAPEWTDSDLCMRCRTPFTTFNRKHHCRNCGQTFCGACSSKLIALPHIGITQEVRVCDGCYSKVSSGRAGSSTAISAAAAGVSTTSGSSTPPSQAARGESDIERKEREELERAIAASLESAKKSTAPTSYSQPKREEPKPKPQSRPPADDEDDEDLKKAIEASLQDLRVDDYTSSSRTNTTYPSTSGGYPSSSYSPSTSTAPSAAATNVNELSTVELDNIRMFSELVERTEADVQARGLGGLNAGGLQVGFGDIFLLHWLFQIFVGTC